MTDGAGAASPNAALVAEALRLNTRYVDEVVLAWNLCPWAEKAFTGGQVRQHVLLDEAPGPEAALPFLDELVAAPEIAIGLLIFPRFNLRAPAFDAFAEKVRRADHARRPDAATSPPAPAFLIAAFHPGATETFKTPPQLVSFLRPHAQSDAAARAHVRPPARDRRGPARVRRGDAAKLRHRPGPRRRRAGRRPPRHPPRPRRDLRPFGVLSRVAARGFDPSPRPSPRYRGARKKKSPTLSLEGSGRVRTLSPWKEVVGCGSAPLLAKARRGRRPKAAGEETASPSKADLSATTHDL